MSKTLLKIDIERDEYKILSEIINLNILCLIIEFTDFEQNIDQIENFVKNTCLKIIHVHGNNFGGIDAKGNPKHLEITFGNPKLVNINEDKINLLKYPIQGLDYPNDTKKNDVVLNFK